mgnify:CR=1 FL=1
METETKRGAASPTKRVSAPTLWVLGAPDPEMVAIEALLRASQPPTVVHASAAGARVRPDTAYAADPVDGPAAWVECAPRGGVSAGDVVIDHHRPGDPGYGRPPAESLAASSIGQVVAHLARIGLLTWERLPWMVAGVPGAFIAPYTAPGADDPDWWVHVAPDVIARVPHDLVLTAAADHCLGAAYRGECPGVDPDALMRWRAASRAAHQKRTVEAVLADVAKAQALLRASPMCADVHDLRGVELPELPEAACRMGVAYVATPAVRAGERVKVVLGCASPDQVAAFLRGEGLAAELVDRYGDPARGFAGGYRP